MNYLYIKILTSKNLYLECLAMTFTSYTIDHIWDIGQCNHEDLSGSPKDHRDKILEYLNQMSFEKLKSIVMELKCYYVNFYFIVTCK